ncbi:MAG: RNA methyltransferase [Bacteroidales bacterium]|nr:RNA methyltransferase [Bacteroidales bacterium]
MHITITSQSNPKIKELVHFQKSNSKRRKENVVIIEGNKEIRFALEAGFKFKEVYICHSLFTDTLLEKQLTEAHSPIKIYSISKEIYQKLAYREGVNGILGIAASTSLSWDDIILPPIPLILVLSAIEKPGNIGAMLRTADAAGVDLVIICDPHCDIYNPNVIRSSVGCVFFNQIITTHKEEVVKWLKENKISIFAASLQAQEFYHETDFSKGGAIVMGSEAEGLEESWYKDTDIHIKIPMLGRNDSLNVASAASILIYEAKRQIGFNKTGN